MKKLLSVLMAVLLALTFIETGALAFDGNDYGGGGGGSDWGATVTTATATVKGV